MCKFKYTIPVKTRLKSRPPPLRSLWFEHPGDLLFLQSMIYCDHTNLLSECFNHLVLAEMSKSPINNPITAHSILSEFYFHGFFSFKAQHQTIRKHTALNSFPFNDNILTLSALLLLHIYLLPADPMSGHWRLHRMRGWHHWWHRDSGAPAQITRGFIVTDYKDYTRANDSIRKTWHIHNFCVQTQNVLNFIFIKLNVM